MAVEYLILGAIGFIAQLVDGALGMAFGLISTTVLLSLGFAPAQASAIVHTAEIFTTGASAGSHLWHRNVDWRLVIWLGVAGVAGAILGAWILSNVNSNAARPFVSGYLLIVGLFVLVRAWKRPRVRDVPAPLTAPVGFIGGFLDAIGGGGWGSIVTSTLVGSGHAPRMAVGSVNATEFFVAFAAATTFFVELGTAPIMELGSLVVGGLLAAPLGGWAVKNIPPRLLMTIVGVLVTLLAAWQLAHTFDFV